MALTREFKETVQARITRDRKYRKELLREGYSTNVNEMMFGPEATAMCCLPSNM